MLAPASLRAVHPLGKSPVIIDEGRTLAESGAIVEYLIERYGNGRVHARPAYVRALARGGPYRYALLSEEEPRRARRRSFAGRC